MRARTVREFQTLAADPAAVPAVGCEFSRTERLLIRFDRATAATPGPTANLINRYGNKMADVPVHHPATAGTRRSTSACVSRQSEYVVEITAKGATGEAKELIPHRFLVTPVTIAVLPGARYDHAIHWFVACRMRRRRRAGYGLSVAHAQSSNGSNASCRSGSRSLRAS